MRKKIEGNIKLKQDETKSDLNDEKKGAFEPIDKATVVKTIESRLPEALHVMKQLYVREVAPKSLGLESRDLLSVTATLFKLPPNRTNPPRDIKNRFVRFPLPHPIDKLESTNVCLILRDDIDYTILDLKAKEKFKHEIDRNTKLWKHELEINGVSGLSLVTTSTELKRECPTFDSRKKLVSAYDAFLIDRSIHESIIRFLGPQFRERRINPQMVTMTNPKNYKSQIETALNKVTLSVNRNAIRVNCKFGRVTNENQKQLIENAKFVIDKLIDNVFGGASNIRKLDINHQKLTPLPIFENDENPNTVDILSLFNVNPHLYPLMKQSKCIDFVETQGAPLDQPIIITRTGKIIGSTKSAKDSKILDLEAYNKRIKDRKIVKKKGTDIYKLKKGGQTGKYEPTVIKARPMKRKSKAMKPNESKKKKIT